MFTNARSNQFQASNPARQLARMGLLTRTQASHLAQPSAYPAVPAMWPNRAVRRAVKLNRMARVPAEWLSAMVRHQGLKQAIKGLA